MERIGKQRVYRTMDNKRINLSCNVESEDCSNSCSFPAIASPCSSASLSTMQPTIYFLLCSDVHTTSVCVQCTASNSILLTNNATDDLFSFLFQWTYNILLCTVYNILIYPPHHWFNRPWRWFISFYIRKFCIYNLISFSGIISLARFIKDPGGIQLIW